MKQTLLFLALIFNLLSCSTENKKEQKAAKGAQDIVIDEIQTACDCSEAFIIVAKEVLDVVAEQQKTNDPELDHQITPRVKILEEIEQKCQYELGIDLDEVIDCDSNIVDIIQNLNQHLN